MRRLSRLLVGALLLFNLAACKYPRDPEGTLDRVEGDTMRIGLVHRPPFVDIRGEDPSGIEVDLLRAFAQSLNASPAFTVAGNTDVMSALAEYKLDVVAGGFTKDDPWTDRVAFTMPYAETGNPGAGPKRREHVLAIGKGENAWLMALDRFLKGRQGQVLQELKEPQP